MRQQAKYTLRAYPQVALGDLEDQRRRRPRSSQWRRIQARRRYQFASLSEPTLRLYPV